MLRSRKSYRLLVAAVISFILGVLRVRADNDTCTFPRLAGPKLQQPMHVLFIHRQSFQKGATHMRGSQIGKVMASHPDITVTHIKVKDCQSYCSRRKSDGVTHVTYVKYPCARCQRHRDKVQILDLVDNIGFLSEREGTVPGIKGKIRPVLQLRASRVGQFQPMRRLLNFQSPTRSLLVKKLSGRIPVYGNNPARKGIARYLNPTTLQQLRAGQSLTVGGYRIGESRLVSGSGTYDALIVNTKAMQKDAQAKGRAAT
eukprot:scaffold233133_cov46-Prasinocladus_malaysianus.AAC.1